MSSEFLDVKKFLDTIESTGNLDAVKFVHRMASCNNFSKAVSKELYKLVKQRELKFDFALSRQVSPYGYLIFEKVSEDLYSITRVSDGLVIQTSPLVARKVYRNINIFDKIIAKN